MTKGLILQRALATFVTHGTVERVVGKKQLNDAFLRALHLRSVGTNHLTIGDGCHAADHHHWPTRTFHFDQALTAHTNRAHAWVVTEARNKFIGAICCSDDEFALTRRDGLAVDGDADRVWIWLGHFCHFCGVIDCCHCPTAVTGMRVRFVTRASNSLRNKVSAE